jgi:hypothetical protein
MAGGNMSDLLMDIGKAWLEWTGRQKPAPKYVFQQNEIVSPGYPRDVSDLWKATYLRLHPTHYAIAISPDGKVINLKGGYNELAPGLYNIYYIDRQKRVNHIPRTGEITSDGYQVAMVLAVTYQVQDPLEALEIQNAVDTLLQFIQSDLKEFIRNRTYDEIMGEPNGHKFDNGAIAYYIKDQHTTRHQLAKLFFISDVIIQEKIGDSRVMDQRERSQTSQREIASQKVLQDLNQELREKVARQDADLQRIKNSSELERQKSNQEIERLRFENERIKAEFQNRQEITMRAMEAIAQAFASPAFLRDPQVAETVWKLFSSMGISRPQPVEPASGSRRQPDAEPIGFQNASEVDSLTDTLLSLLARKRA